MRHSLYQSSDYNSVQLPTLPTAGTAGTKIVCSPSSLLLLQSSSSSISLSSPFLFRFILRGFLSISLSLFLSIFLLLLQSTLIRWLRVDWWVEEECSNLSLSPFWQIWFPFLSPLIPPLPIPLRPPPSSTSRSQVLSDSEGGIRCFLGLPIFPLSTTIGTTATSAAAKVVSGGGDLAGRLVAGVFFICRPTQLLLLSLICIWLRDSLNVTRCPNLPVGFSWLPLSRQSQIYWKEKVEPK